MWTKRDWHKFFQTMNSRWERYRPARPVAPALDQKMEPAAGFSVGELNAVGLTVEQAEMFGLPVDIARLSSHTANVSALRVFVRQTRGHS
jgi:ribosomal protein L13E